MGSVATGAPAGAAELRALAAKKSKAYNSSLDQELWLLQGGTLAEWYAVAAAPPAQTEQERQRARLARLLRHMPDGLTVPEQTAWIAAAEATL